MQSLRKLQAHPARPRTARYALITYNPLCPSHFRSLSPTPSCLVHPSTAYET